MKERESSMYERSKRALLAISAVIYSMVRCEAYRQMILR